MQYTVAAGSNVFFFYTDEHGSIVSMTNKPNSDKVIISIKDQRGKVVEAILPAAVAVGLIEDDLPQLLKRL